ncbi:peptide/nickel transport system ATP-binding protein/oligopeptide transport system ATP-binding protein [Antricoccus suffuscus]|uniref:Peptide/nickel transport system ATP-binding protein/oligopeptide transport system ATP-binding protein n=1 Tax=Antricoccus suffuscus TaxID=1629062 RepID=A0A2T1A1E2_9ACTN|nr:ABC transporter ATP-binding protein [Antricoccus suffuscus]PRZ42422.1 peptide/nickel transport system ATP-binding protein/oligopeptide transport system ATP-binding protein [Antricoccus suffuscus]
MSDTSTQPLLRIEDLQVDFATDHGWANVVNGVSFDVAPNEIVGLVGESGSGKTVTSLSILGLIPQPPGRKSGGHIWYRDKDLTEMPPAELRKIRGNEISMIFQEPMTSLNPAFTIGDQIAEAYRQHRGGKKKAAMDRAAQMLDLVGIPNASRRVRDYPHEFSGGMRQRAMIAMALVCDPKLLIADEPTTALDVTVQAQILELLSKLRDETGTGIIFITHDLGVVSELCDKVVVMYAGEVVETAVGRDLFVQPKHPYTEGLLTAMPQLGERGEQLASIPGRTPEPWAMPGGCRFNPRCKYTTDVCRSGVIPLERLGDGRASRCARIAELTLEGAK